MSAKCESYTIDPTLAPPARLATFKERVSREFITTVNSSVGLGSGPIVAAMSNKPPFPIVNLRTLLHDRYGLTAANPLHVAILKVCGALAT